MRERLQDSIKKGVEYLYKNQMLHGEFKTYISPDTNMKEKLQYVSTTYITTFVLYSLSFIDSPLIDKIKTRAAQFLLEEMEEGGIWRFFTTNRNIKLSGGRLEYYTQIGIVPDLDDTAVISYCLKKNSVDIPDNLKVFLNNRNEAGLFYTWLMDVPKRAEYIENMPYMNPSKNDICSGVSANVLLYLGENEYTRPVCDYLNKLIIEDKLNSSYVYFPNSFVIYYLISRAYFNGAKGLEDSKVAAIEGLIDFLDREKHALSPLNTAYVACSLLNYGVSYKALENAVVYILESQDNSGYWDKERFCDGGSFYYGSEELTTALCMEALSRYYNSICNV